MDLYTWALRQPSPGMPCKKATLTSLVFYAHYRGNDSDADNNYISPKATESCRGLAWAALAGFGISK